jgi:hypothetical protein
VLVEITRNPDARIRDIALAGLTERAVQAIVADPEAAGYLTRTRTGRRTAYTVDPDTRARRANERGLPAAQARVVQAVQAASQPSVSAWRDSISANALLPRSMRNARLMWSDQ